MRGVPGSACLIVFTLRRPSPQRIAQFIKSQEMAGFSYEPAGMTRGAPPGGFNVDLNSVQIGAGREAFELAKEQLRHWRMFDLSWLRLWPATAPFVEGQTVAVLVSHFGFWSLNACRIVYVIDEATRFGFAYGTLEDHAEMGEERFEAEIRGSVVHYSIRAYSRPRQIARLFYPLSRLLQKRFARDSVKAMVRGVRSTT